MDGYSSRNHLKRDIHPLKYMEQFYKAFLGFLTLAALVVILYMWMALAAAEEAFHGL